MPPVLEESLKIVVEYALNDTVPTIQKHNAINMAFIFMASVKTPLDTTIQITQTIMYN